MVSAGAEGVFSAARLAALRRMGLSASADAGMERFARLVASMLRVPVALVALVEEDRQVFPGLVGLAEPWATSRQTPLSHSLCQHVTATGSPLVLPDARQDERTRASLAIGDLGVIAYAGMPLTDGQGLVLGSLCAIDTRPRSWSQRELADLADLAAACSAELRLRIVSQDARQAQDDAELARRAAEAAQGVAERSEDRAQAFAAQARVTLGRAELMLRAAEDLADTAGLADVRRRLGDLVSGDLKPAYVGLALLDGQQLRRVPDPEVPHAAEAGEQVFALGSDLPSARAAREGRMVIIGDRAALEAGYGPAAADQLDAAGLGAVVCVPLPGIRRIVGTLILGWKTQHRVDVTEQAVLTAIAGYTARAIERALYLDERITVARELQQAMLTDLPGTSGLQLAALYRPALAGDLVGGDWYDAYPLTARSGGRQPGGADHVGIPLPLAVTVGDITGHDVRAAAIMGQVRSMLRQADLDLGLGPAAAVTAMERACAVLSLDATGTLIHAHLRPAASSGGWRLTWTNAGHPPPLLRHPDGRIEQLDEHERLLWPGVPGGGRTDHQRVLAPGAMLLLYTDGLVEHRGDDMDAAIARAAALLAGAPADLPLPDLLRQLVDEVADPAYDNTVLLAARIPPAYPA